MFLGLELIAAKFSELSRVHVLDLFKRENAKRVQTRFHDCFCVSVVANSSTCEKLQPTPSPVKRLLHAALSSLLSGQASARAGVQPE